MAGNLPEGGGRRDRGDRGELASEFVAVRAQLLCPGLERGEPSGEVFGFECVAGLGALV
ncbi:MAG TPA: hypothetical protein VMU94_03395 [Streptosporangiaceae bacterium]|nr:hypothetical protein [Streptosporangiaceae bacterium]